MGQITDLIQAAHQNAIAKGWWDEDRTFGEIIALIQSEVAEALEDFRAGKQPAVVWYEKKGAMGAQSSNVSLGADWKPCGIPSELADIIIRIFDCCGRYGWAERFESACANLNPILPDMTVKESLPFAENLTIINYWLSNSYFHTTDAIRLLSLVTAAMETYELSRFYGIDLNRAISEKMAYNTTRPQRHGGKVL